MMIGAGSISDIKAQGFSTQSQRENDAIIVQLTGNADMAVHEQLKNFLDEVHRSAMTTRVRETIFELQDLYFMNSSCLSLFLRLINTVLESRYRYALRFRSNPNLRWQKRSLEAIRSYAQDVVIVD
jgi:anti-anti-sigma factor